MSIIYNVSVPHKVVSETQVFTWSIIEISTAQPNPFRLAKLSKLHDTKS